MPALCKLTLTRRATCSVSYPTVVASREGQLLIDAASRIGTTSASDLDFRACVHDQKPTGRVVVLDKPTT